MAQVFNVINKGKEADIEIVGDIGYNWWADTYEDYKKNTSEGMAKQLNEIAALKVDVINVTLESLGGDVAHALAIYNQLRQTGAKLIMKLRGANASSSTIISSAANLEDIYMDNTGLYLIHKPMSGSWGNSNDLEETINGLAKWQKSIEQTYLNLGVKQEVITDLMERNGGNGEWLTFNEAKEYGFVGNEWTPKKVGNYKPEDFTNKGLLAPKNIINQNSKIMQEQDKKGLFSEFKNWLKGEQEQEDAQTTIQNLKTENEQLKNDLATFKNKVDELEAAKVVEEVEEVTETTEVEEVAETQETIIANLVKEGVKEEIRNALNPDNVKKETPKNDIKTPTWKKHLDNTQKLNK